MNPSKASKARSNTRLARRTSAGREYRNTLRESEERLRSIMANSLDVIYRRNLRTDRYDCVSPSVREVTGFTPEEFMAGGLSATLDRVHPDDVALAHRKVASVMKGTSGRGFAEYRYRRKDGVYRWFADHFTITRDARGAPLYWVGTVRDVTLLKRFELALKRSRLNLEAKVKKRTRQLASMTARMITAEEAERERIGHILHEELQQILTGLRYELHVLKDSAPTRAQVEAVLPIIDGAIQLTRSLSTDMLRPALMPGELAPGLDWLVADMRQRLGLTVKLRLDRTIEPEEELLRVFVFRSIRELLLNVVKHAGINSAELTTKRRTGPCMRIEVIDHGVGFDPSTPRPGGLGLFRIGERASAFGGTLKVVSRPGQGTRVRMDIPIRHTILPRT